MYALILLYFSIKTIDVMTFNKLEHVLTLSSIRIQKVLFSIVNIIFILYCVVWVSINSIDKVSDN